MAITFFSVNGAGNTGGGGGSVTTANGISGDGSAGTPIILGGNPLNQATTIDLAAFQLSFSDTSDPANNLGVTLISGLYQILLSNTVTGFNGFLQIITGGVTLSTSDAANSKSIAIINTGGSGIIVSDDIDHLGIHGSTDFSAAVLANVSQLSYPQLITVYSLLSSFLTGTLTADAIINIGAHSIFFESTDPTNNASFDIDCNGTGINSNFGVNNLFTYSQTAIGNNVVTVETENLGAGRLRARLSYFDNVNIKSISADNTINGISVVDDINLIGLVGIANFSTAVLASPGGLAYPQLITVQNLIAANTTTPNVAAQDVAGQTTSVTVVSYTLPITSDGMIRVSAYGFYRTGLGSVAFAVNWIDNVVSGAHTASLGTALSSGFIDTAYASVTVKAKAGTVVSVTATLTGAMTYDTGGVIEFLAP